MGLAPWPWNMENAVVDSARHFCGQPLPSLFHSFLPRLLPAFSRHETVQEYWAFDWLISLFFCFACVLFKASFEFEGTSLFINYLLFFLPWRGTERDTFYSAFHVLNQMSGSQSYSPCRAQFTVSPGAWGRGPRRRRLILLALSLLREINALCNIWHMPSIPWAERTEKFALGTTCTEVIGAVGREHFIFVMCWRYHILNYLMHVVYSNTFVLAQAGTRSGHFRRFHL